MSDEIRVVAAAILRDGRVLAALRGPAMRLAGHWELPGGKVEPGEDDRDALGREILEELGVEVRVQERLGESVFAYDTVTVRLVAYACTLAAGEPAPTEHARIGWFAAHELDQLLWAPADVPLLGAVQERLGGLGHEGRSK